MSMETGIRYFLQETGNQTIGRPREAATFLDEAKTQEVIRFHRSIHGYKPAPLHFLKHLAERLGVRAIFIKDESYRFGLNAFKVLGATYAIGRHLSARLGIPVEEASFELLRSAEAKQKLGAVTFVTATDGNHGRAVAWAAQQLGQKAVVFLPKGSAEQRVEAIRQTGAEAHVTDGNYDEAVRLSRKMAEENGWQVVQDTAWEGYTDIPRWIMQGYTTMAREALEQLEESGEPVPTHVFLQAGVGSMAAAVHGYLQSCLGDQGPATIIVEPHTANCLYQSAQIGDGAPHTVDGDLETIMAGLACGEPNPIAWEILRDHAAAFVSCPDWVAATGMRMLAAPPGDDPRIISGESGAVGLGLLAEIMRSGELSALREHLGLGKDSVILLFSTEGNTDAKQYEDVVWGGKYPLVPDPSCASRQL
ncbi:MULTISPECIES: diaminopropionate ammonia-lyase [Brevibacillus]|uniref:diaminopropionate ammonia-lyase n=1 Tax=Brevibacillus TaxID=55080 RepID=UPI0004F24B4C|nr:diaminopropionate ammonia-lyase [Brevibacillus borstelensis]